MRRERLLDSKTTATFLGCTPAALALWRKQRRGPTYVRLGLRLVRYRERDLARWLAAGRVEARSQNSRAVPKSQSGDPNSQPTAKP
jgi:predicted DNA-binding transcriptional regulator AlpA